MYKENLKTVILEAMKEVKMSKTTMAKKLNMSLPTYYKFENDGIISLEDYIKACDLFELHIQIVPKKYVTSL